MMVTMVTMVYLVSYRVDDIDMLSGRSGYLCERYVLHGGCG